MIRKVLIVDDDQEMLLSLKEGLDKYNETFSVLLAGDGRSAVSKLKEGAVSLVVTDLKMPGMDGLELLAHIMENYPDIPVIFITAYGTPEIEKRVSSEGAVGYLEKPFYIDDLARKIMATMRQEADGGTLHGVSSGMFLQLIEMEQKTCTVRLEEKASGKRGVLFFKEGELLDARVNDLQGLEAAYQIFAWDEVTISIQNVCQKKTRKIDRDLQSILLEGMRRKDESEEQRVVEPDAVEELEYLDEEAGKPQGEEQGVESIRKRLEKELGERAGIEDIYFDKSWDSLLAQTQRIGDCFGAGNLKVAYFDMEKQTDQLLMPAEETLVISVNPRFPRDRVLQILSE